MRCKVTMSLIENTSNRGKYTPAIKILSITSGVSGTTLSLRSLNFDKIPNLMKSITGLPETFDAELEFSSIELREFYEAVYDGWTGMPISKCMSGQSVSGNTTKLGGDELSFSIDRTFCIGTTLSKAKEIHVHDVNANYINSGKISVRQLEFEQSSYGDFQTYDHTTYSSTTNGSVKPIEGNPTQWIEIEVAGNKRRVPSW